MSVAQLTTADRRTRDAVLQELEWDPAVDASAIGVTARDGVVTLTGHVDTLPGKLAAERAAKAIRGVRAVANGIVIRPRVQRTDGEIAAEAIRALDLRGTVSDHVQLVVREGHITLTGRVGRFHAKEEAEKAVRRVKGLRGIYNHITINAEAAAEDVRQCIVQALRRNADVDARHLQVAVKGTVATLGGTVTTWRQRDVVERAAAHAPGITCVENDIVVEPPVEPIDEQC